MLKQNETFRSAAKVRFFFLETLSELLKRVFPKKLSCLTSACLMNILTTIDVTVSNRVNLVLGFAICLVEKSDGDLMSPGTEQTPKGGHIVILLDESIIFILIASAQLDTS